MSRTKLVIIAVSVFMVLAVLLYLYLSLRTGSSLPFSPKAPLPSPSAAGTAQPQTLGGAIYQGASNPIQNKIPDAAPVTNPVNGLYKNPFQ